MQFLFVRIHQHANDDKAFVLVLFMNTVDQRHLLTTWRTTYSPKVNQGVSALSNILVQATRVLVNDSVCIYFVQSVLFVNLIQYKLVYLLDLGVIHYTLWSGINKLYDFLV